MSQQTLYPGEELVNRGEFAEAFRYFEAMANDPEQDPNVRADAYHWLGTLVRISPTLGTEDECGLAFFKRALQLNPNQIWSMLGIVSTFGDHFPDHQDKEAFQSAMHGLMERVKMLDKDSLEELNRIKKQYSHL